MEKRRCNWYPNGQTRCKTYGTINFRLNHRNTNATEIMFRCSEHMEEGMKLNASQGHTFETIPKKNNKICCSLVLCKTCMDNLDEVLDF